MDFVAPSHVLEGHLGLSAHEAGMVAAERYRSVLVTVHRPRARSWTWRERPPEAARAAVLFPRGDDADERRPPAGLFVPPGATQTLVWSSTSEIVAIWVAWEALQGRQRHAPPATSVLPASPMIIAFRAFSRTIARAREASTLVSQYAIERLLTDMTAGALRELAAVSAPDHDPVPLEERARSAMRVHRDDPDFTVAELADELHVSLRHLERAFAEGGTTPAATLRALRVEVAESLLTDPDLAELSIDEVAAHSGFSGALQLRRALRAAGLPSPSAIRGRPLGPVQGPRGS
ncbi:helix-turn-helix domain-containing protein [uncultured Microbacterium sp.]|uniref:AraC family transcriptional regulator n=1 Tax=uncultured Microbacterium sp. TaxID=191216 RepID=UPI0025E2C65F|nr:helix-turn-helix domain-containing protein [uncultured Microbacterium sp.]